MSPAIPRRAAPSKGQHPGPERQRKKRKNARGQLTEQGLGNEEYEHYLDLLDDETDSQDEELAARLTQAATPPQGGTRQAFRDYLSERDGSDADKVGS